MKKLLVAAFVLLCAPLLASAQSILNVYQTADIAAPPGKVWGLVNGWNSLHAWHPVFVSTRLISGENNVVGSMRQLTIKDGPSFDEELLQYNAQDMMLQYRIVGQNDLPIQDYNSMLGVTPIGPDRTLVVWRSMFRSKPGQKDDDNMKLINGVFRAGLDNLKQMSEAR
jgi:hypothetical protein